MLLENDNVDTQSKVEVTRVVVANFDGTAELAAKPDAKCTGGGKPIFVLRINTTKSYFKREMN